MTNKKLLKRISVAMLAMTLLSFLCLATMVFATETTGASGTETVVYDYVENKDDGGFLKSILGFFGKILSFCNQITGNYIFALFLFSVLMQLALCFVGIKQQKNSVGQARLAPKIAAINKKYAGRNDQATLQKKQQETMELYQKEGFNPMGGCLPLLIQMPVIMILYYVVIAPMQYILGLSATVATNLGHMLMKFDATFAAGDTRALQMNIINWFRQNGQTGVDNLKSWIENTVAPANGAAASAYTEALEKIADKVDSLPNFSVGPVDLAQIPSFTGNTTLGEWLLLLIPALTLVFLLLTQSLTKRFTYQTPESKEMQDRMSMKIMTWSMPLLSVYFTFVVPAAIGIYWIFRNILNLCQQMILYKVMPIPKYSEEDYKAAERELMGSSQRKKEKAAARERDPNRPKVRSLHHIDDEGYENGYKIDPNAPAEEEEVLPAGATTENKDAPAPIKNDEKSSYAPKKKKAKDESDENK